MSRRLRAVALGWVCLASVVGAQRGAAPPMATGTGFILGQVVDADTGRGLAGVLVTLAPPAPPAPPVGELTEARVTLAAPSPATVKRVLTAADGRSLFRDLPKGRFSITAAIGTHVPGAYGQLRPTGPSRAIELGESEKLGAIAIKLWRHGSISGTVRDESGEPAPGVAIECFRRVFAGGQKRFSSGSASTTTDDRGMFRIAGLMPGDYICGNLPTSITMPMSVQDTPRTVGGVATEESRTMNNSGATSSSLSGPRVGSLIYWAGTSTSGLHAPPPDANGRLQAYGHQYHGGSATTAQAALVSLKSGEERSGVDIQLRLVPAVRVSGRLVGPDGPAGFIGLTLVPAAGNDMVSEGQASFARTTTDATGAFTFLGVPAGDYVVKGRLFPRPAPGGNPAAVLEENTLWVSTPLVVGSKDLTNLSMTMRRGGRLSGRVEFAGIRAATAAELTRIAVRLQSAEGRTSSPIALDGRTQTDGTFKTSGYPDGRYIANVLPFSIPPGWSVKSIMINGRDASVEPFELSGADIAGAVITLTDKTTTLSGTVTRSGTADDGAEVVVFPADSLAWKEYGVVARRFRAEGVTKAGTFSILGLPPGEYFVAVVAGTLDRDRQDPALLAMLMRDASRVTLTDGGNATVTLAVKR